MKINKIFYNDSQSAAIFSWIGELTNHIGLVNLSTLSKFEKFYFIKHKEYFLLLKIYLLQKLSYEEI